MNKLKEVPPSYLDDPVERNTARLARIARGNTVFGGASAIGIAERMEKRGSKVPAMDVVRWVYSHSNYSVGPYGAYACPECGQAWLGEEKAYACCNFDPDEED